MPETTAALFDSLVLAAVAAEIRALGPARYAGVRQPSPDTVVVNLAVSTAPAGTVRGAVRHLLCCIHPEMARIHFAAELPAAERLGPFGQLIRSRLAEGHLAEVDQPPFDRVLRLGFDALGGRLWLVAELMGRHSNLLLVDGRGVLGALKVVTAQMSPRRPVLPGRPYRPPPADRPTPDTLEAEHLRGLLQSAQPLARRLSQALLGVSPTLAREIAVRVGLDPAMPAAAAADSADRLLQVLREISAMLAEGAFSPTVYTDGDRPAAFAAFPMRVFAGLTAHPVGTMSEAIDRFGRERAPASPLEARRAELAATVGAALAKREAALEEHRRALTEAEAADRYRVMGDLVLTYARAARPRDPVLRVPDHTAGGAEIAIPLDPALSPSENAQKYFRRYAKARAVGRALPARIAEVEAEARALRDALVQIGTAATTDDLREIQEDLAAAGVLGRRPSRSRIGRDRKTPTRRDRSRPAAGAGPRRFHTADGATILAGRSARENDRITFREAGPDDLWFHARGMAGAHVILKAGGAPTEEHIAAAAGVAAHYSEGRHSPQVAVDWVARKHVRKPRGAGPGAVTYAGERTLLVSPALPEG